jgi:ParB family chromosome partitioning protein
MHKKGGLGRGMASLLPAAAIADDASYFLCPIEQIRPNKNQPRKRFTAEALEELAASIKAQGIIQPLVVTKRDGGYEIIAGERRWRAAQRAGLREVPVVIRDVADEAVLELALIENIQREELNVIEEAEAYRTLVELFGIAQDEVARRVGKSRTTITNTLRLLRLPDDIRQDLIEQRMSMGHARALLGLDDQSLIQRARHEIIAKQLSVRATEELVNRLKRGGVVSKRPPQQPDLLLMAVEEQLQRRFQSRVSISRNAKGQGALSIAFGSTDELTRIIDLLQE